MMLHFLPPSKRPKTIFQNIMPDFRHRSDQIYHIWKTALGDPFIILSSILEGSVLVIVESI